MSAAEEQVSVPVDAVVVRTPTEDNASEPLAHLSPSPTTVQEAPAGTGAVSPTTSEIRDAFKVRDADASKTLHETRLAVAREGDQNAAALISAAKERHGGAGSDRVKSIVFGGLDGIITTFSIVAAVAGASLSIQVVLLMGIANLIADGISMGAGDYISSKAEHDFVRSERDRESWEMDNYPEGEVEEMVELYKDAGVAEEDARTILKTMAKYKELFVDHMMVMELGQMSPDASDSPAKDGLATFISFLVFGSVPIWVYGICFAAGYKATNGLFGIACAAVVITLFMLGAFQGRLTRQNPWKTGVLLMLNGSAAAAAAYLVGWGLDKAIGKGESNC